MQTNTKAKKATLRRHMMSMLSMVIVAAIALSSATYAWFTFVSNPEVRNLDLYVKAAENIFLSPYPDMDRRDVENEYFFNEFKWFAVLEMETDEVYSNDGTTDYFNGIKNHQPAAFPDELSDISSIFNAGSRDFFGRQNFDSGEFNYYYNLNAPGDNDPLAEVNDPWNDAENKGGYVRFDLWIKSSTNGMIFLDGSTLGNNILPNTFVIPIYQNDDEEWEKLEDGDKVYVQHTVRVGFYCASDSNGDTHAVIWEPNSQEHVPESILGGVGEVGYLATMAIVEDYDHIVDDTGEKGEEQKTYDFGETTTNADPGNKIDLFYLIGGEDADPILFSVYIWVEGADVDTVNAVAKSYFRTQLRFGQERELDTSPTPTTAP